MYIFKSISVRVMLLLMLCGTLVSCTDFDSLNTPPDRIASENVDQGLLGQAFAQSQFRGFMGNYSDFQQAQNLFADLYAQYYATSINYFDTDQLVHIPLWAQWGWRAFYRDAAPQLHFVVDFAEENNLELEHAVASVWKVLVYSRMTDYWGPIIYSDFGSTETNVEYDAQEDIYRDFFQTLDSAVAVLKQNAGGQAFFDHDLLYNGNVDQWLVFANSLRLRLAMRVSYVDADLAEDEVAKAIEGGVMTSNADNAAVLTTDFNRHPQEQVSQWDEYRMSAAMESMLTGYDDPRISSYFNEAADPGGYRGLRNGVPRAERAGIGSDYSFVDTKYHGLSAGGSNPDIKVMEASEVYFLRAEAALKGWDAGGTPMELYNEGIRASMERETDLTSTEIEAYITSTNTPVALNDNWNSPAVHDVPVLYDPTGSPEEQLEQIITQKWIALYPDGWEAWTERRRTGYPQLYPVVESLDPDIPEDAIISRLPFVPMEYQDNTAAVERAIELLPGQDDGRLVRLWWDAK